MPKIKEQLIDYIASKKSEKKESRRRISHPLQETRKLKREIIEQLDHLETDEQRRVLEFVRSLNPTNISGIPGRLLTSQSYGFDFKDLEEMEKTINEGCETVNFNEW